MQNSCDFPTAQLEDFYEIRYFKKLNMWSLFRMHPVFSSSLTNPTLYVIVRCTRMWGFYKRERFF